MCLYASKLDRAVSDIKCFKFEIKLPEEAAEWATPYSRRKSPGIGEAVRSRSDFGEGCPELFLPVEYSNRIGRRIEFGIHSMKDVKGAIWAMGPGILDQAMGIGAKPVALRIIKCTIPRGALYFEGTWKCEIGSYSSKTLIYDEVIFNSEDYEDKREMVNKLLDLAKVE